MKTWPDPHPALRVSRFKSVSDLSQLIPDTISTRIIDIRKHVPIAVIDDEKFEMINNLKNSYQFNITSFNDLSRTDQVIPYSVIMVDLKGVGKEFGSRIEGAEVIKEIKKSFPEKSVIAYTSRIVGEAYSVAYKYSDEFIKKDEDILIWTNTLDKYIVSSVNPIDFWKKFRIRILDAGATPHQLSYIEEKFIKLISNNSTTHDQVHFSDLISFTGNTEWITSTIKSMLPLLKFGFTLLSHS